MASAALAGLSAGSSLFGGLMGSKAAETYLKYISQGKVDASALNWLLYNQSRRDQAPYANAGAGAVNLLSYLLGIGGGANGQSASQYDSGKILNKPTASATAGMDGKFGTITGMGSNQFSWTPGSGNKRQYQFLYNDGTNDVYQRVGGGPGTGVNIDFAVVGKDGKVNFTGQPPIGNQFGGGNTGAPAGSENDPNFGSLMRDFSLSDFQADPGYQFRLGEGQKALERSAAAKGKLYSGGTLKDLTNYNQDFASNEFANSYNRFQNNRATKYNQLASLAGLGQISANQITGQTGQLGSRLGDYTMNAADSMGNARASGYAAWGQGIQGAVNSIGDYLNQKYGQKK